jgi:hypothetical protein
MKLHVTHILSSDQLTEHLATSVVSSSQRSQVREEPDVNLLAVTDLHHKSSAWNYTSSSLPYNGSPYLPPTASFAWVSLPHQPYSTMAIAFAIEPASTIPQPIPWHARLKDWFRRLKIRYQNHHAGPVKPNPKTDLYFDYRTTRTRQRQTAETAHPGDAVYLDEELVKDRKGMNTRKVENML